MNRRFDLVIAGAGMVGLATAAMLARSAFAPRLRLTIVDAGAAPSFDPASDIDLRVSAISPGSAAVLGKAGVWDGIRSSRSCPFVSMRVWDADGSADDPATLRFDAADLALPELGHIVENRLIQNRLLQILAQCGQQVRFGTPVRELLPAGDRFLVNIAAGDTLSPELLIAADGVNSFVRNAAGIRMHAWQYAQSALVTHVQTERHHGHTAWQRFLRSGPLALLPLADGRVSIVWSTTTGQAAQALDASDQQLGEMLSDASDHVLGRLTPAGPRGSFPLRAQYAAQYALPGLVLAGDAAHSVHPLAGQGANLGLADAAVLVQEIERALAQQEHPGDLPVLRRYARSRKGANQLMLGFIDGINRLFATDFAPVAALRSGGMQLFNRSGPIRRQAVEVALGLRR